MAGVAFPREDNLQPPRHSSSQVRSSTSSLQLTKSRTASFDATLKVPALGLGNAHQRSTGSASANSARGPRRSDASGGSLPLSARLPDPRQVRREQQKRKEIRDKFEVMQNLRSRDEKAIEDKRNKMQQAREERLEEALEALYSDNMLGAQASSVLLDHDARQEAKRQALYDKWDAEVVRRVEYHVGKFMNSVALPPPVGLERCRLLPGDDPLKTCLRELRKEESFHRRAAAFLDGSDEAYASAQAMEQAVVSRATSRPIVPMEKWARPLPPVLPAEEGGTRTSRKIGGDAHRAPLDEADGVPAAGKTRTRFQRHLLGSLEGDLRKGEAAQHKTACGASCGAPCQDHYTFEIGPGAVDVELPLGKRCFPDQNL